MHSSPLAGLTVLAMAGGSLLATSPAQAAGTTYLYVNGSATSCSDTGLGSSTQPFCTIGASATAAQAGQTVRIASGDYPERVALPRSGATDAPIVFETGWDGTSRATLTGATAGVVVAGRHDVVLRGLRITGSLGAPALDLRDSSTVTVDQLDVVRAGTATGAAVQLTAVTRSSLRRAHVVTPVTGVTLDAATSGVTLTSSTISSPSVATSGTGVQVAGTGNAVLNNTVGGFAASAIAVESVATGTVVANNQITGGPGYGIRNQAATGTAITNNSVQYRCRDGVRVEGASTGVSVQNNVLFNNGSWAQDYCVQRDGYEIGVYGDARQDTIVDYNNVWHGGYPLSPYSWDGTPLTLAAFRATAGQGAHDRETDYNLNNQDSANSAAPGYQTTDRTGGARVDNPDVPNTGVGPVAYADRGSGEAYLNPVAKADVTLDLGTLSATMDASASVPGFDPITTYRFDFGDGTVVTQSTPVATHRYANPGRYSISVWVSGADARTGTTFRTVSVLRRISTVALLARSNLKYVSPPASAHGLVADHYGVDSVDRFDLADSGSGQVALYSRSANRYVSTSDATTPVDLTYTNADNGGYFALVRNSDGSVSLRSASSNRYLSTSGSGGTVYANQFTISRFEQFHLVNVADANRTLKARANARYVTASNTAASPLIANATGIGVAQKYDLVDLGNSQWAIFARANNRFVTATNAGTLPLINTNVVPGTWEKFARITNSDGSLSLRSVGNSRYVTADNAGASPLITKHTAITSWDQYTLG
ncbi:right-handed parallel beta-helix repeat-containing protein [Micromonospora siamensis]|uniref:PKD domain-containing protein n=1 Tax=Micromonospora siamensis TaxID=299152 RepID=A0A1C5GZ01_9ACTN|nr:right-handed parallel beta-helix repeat-containing protein [Micromonospora siamensis]SCG38994.1 PKD domain-containing protein [Micromonospora siamensis]